MNDFTHVFGIDPSLCGTAVCSWDRRETDPKKFSMKRISSEPLGDGAIERAKRWLGIVEQIEDELWSHSLVLIEGYSFGSPKRKGAGSRAYDAAELGGLIRAKLLEFDCTVIEVAPSTLKKFVTGIGKGEKEKMILHVWRRWKEEFPTNDECDAYALSRLARCVAAWDVHENQKQWEVISGLQAKVFS